MTQDLLDMVTKQRDALADALRTIRDQRDYCAEHGRFNEAVLDGACFDDWAADIASTVLDAQGLPAIPPDLAMNLPLP